MSNQQPEKFSEVKRLLGLVHDFEFERKKLKEIIGKQQDQLKSNQEFIGTLIQKMEDGRADMTAKQNQLTSTIDTGFTPVWDNLREIHKSFPSFVAPDSEHTEINANN